MSKVLESIFDHVDAQPDAIAQVFLWPLDRAAMIHTLRMCAIVFEAGTRSAGREHELIPFDWPYSFWDAIRKEEAQVFANIGTKRHEERIDLLENLKTSQFLCHLLQGTVDIDDEVIVPQAQALFFRCFSYSKSLRSALAVKTLPPVSLVKRWPQYGAVDQRRMHSLKNGLQAAADYDRKMGIAGTAERLVDAARRAYLQ